MADLTDEELASITESLGGAEIVAQSRSETARMVAEIRRRRARQATSEQVVLGALKAGNEAIADIRSILRVRSDPRVREVAATMLLHPVSRDDQRLVAEAYLKSTHEEQ